MFGSSDGEPYWHQPTQSSPAYTSVWCTVPFATWRRLASRLPSGVCPVPTPSGWNPMHQQPPQTPLFASTRRAKPSQVAGVSGLVVYTGSEGDTQQPCHRHRTPAIRHGYSFTIRGRSGHHRYQTGMYIHAADGPITRADPET